MGICTLQSIVKTWVASLARFQRVWRSAQLRHVSVQTFLAIWREQRVAAPCRTQPASYYNEAHIYDDFPLYHAKRAMLCVSFDASALFVSVMPR